ncbi:hypothetical protein [Alteribacter aurantiacus]|uniref:hypothetical protein n=1 Tax=Alteribacter aurantiacus TaxID=254410 RepID=UPI00042781BC|nr:hypothetical protein [Alteribacter aurantiacus]
MMAFMKKNGLWVVCFVVFCVVVGGMTIFSGNDREASAGDEEEMEVEESAEDEKEEERSENGESGDGEAEEQESEGSEKDGTLDKEEDGEVMTVAFGEGMELNAKATLGSAHDYLNELTGWNRIQDLEMSEVKVSGEWHRLREELSFLYNDGFAASVAKEDIGTAMRLVEMAESGGDIEALRFLHRVVHDLDIHINEADGDDWGVTAAFGYENKAEGLQVFLENGE